jgi:alanyl-tRNA synthetase
MTTRLYYDDSYNTSFDARVTAVSSLDGQLLVQLDRTCFYPTSGGQPHDTGLLNGVPVLDVRVEDGLVLHVLDGAAAPSAEFHAGGAVKGAIDWPRRYDHMQQHSGQHLLSQLFWRLFGIETVSVHFGALESTLDLDAAALEPDQIAAAEQEANRLAYTALPFKTYSVDEKGLAAIPLRRAPKVTGSIRIVEIDGYDYSACGGTHVHTTAEITPLKILRQEKRRGQTRLTFLCGRRAYEDYAAKHRLLSDTAAIFSTDIGAVPGLVQRAIDQNRDLQRQVDALAEQLVAHEVEALAATMPHGQLRVVTKLYSDRSVDAIKHAATLLRAYPGTLALLATQAGGKLTLVFARSEDVTLHAGNLLRDTLKAFGGSGGGRPDFAQGGGVEPAQGTALLEHAAALAATYLHQA